MIECYSQIRVPQSQLHDTASLYSLFSLDLSYCQYLVPYISFIEWSLSVHLFSAIHANFNISVLKFTPLLPSLVERKRSTIGLPSVYMWDPTLSGLKNLVSLRIYIRLLTLLSFSLSLLSPGHTP